MSVKRDEVVLEWENRSLTEDLADGGPESA